MLQIIRSGRQLHMHQLFSVYAHSIAECGEERHPRGSVWEQLRIGEEAFRESVFSFLRMEGAAMALWSEQNRCTAALRLEPYLDGLLISCLETAPEARGRGCATALMKAVLASFPGPFYSHVHKQNEISMKLHNKLGFSVISDCGRLLDGTTSCAYYTLKYEH